MIAQPRLVEPLRDGFEDAGDEGPAFAFGLGQFVGDMLVVLGFEIAQGDVFEFALDVVQTQFVGDLGVEVEGVSRTFL